MALERGEHRDGGPRLAHRSPVVIQIVSNPTLARSTDKLCLESLVLGLTAPVRASHISARSGGDIAAAVDWFVTRRRAAAPLRQRTGRWTRLSRAPLRNEVFEKLRDAIDVSGRHGFI